ncbi:hypothetical protein PF003_g19672 [Phytophthora fragariae]|nr:hypothetical protein PF003_g19672 [Phytophthora fragariae]
MVALRARVQDAEARLERLQNVRQDLDFLRVRVWDLPRQLDEEAVHLRTRCSQGEENDALAHQSLERYLDWIRTLNDRVGSLVAQEARRVAARAPACAPAPAPAPAHLPSEELVRMMANAFQQFNKTWSPISNTCVFLRPWRSLCSFCVASAAAMVSRTRYLTATPVSINESKFRLTDVIRPLRFLGSLALASPPPKLEAGGNVSGVRGCRSPFT